VATVVLSGKLRWKKLARGCSAYYVAVRQLIERSIAVSVQVSRQKTRYVCKCKTGWGIVSLSLGMSSETEVEGLFVALFIVYMV
jgi:hypothetical protein